MTQPADAKSRRPGGHKRRRVPAEPTPQTEAETSPKPETVDGWEEPDEALEAISARARSAEGVEGRVKAIRDLMLADDWKPTLIPPLAKCWGISEGHVRHMSAEASRHVRDSANKPLYRARYLDVLEDAVEVAKLELSAERGSPAKASEAMTKAVLASAQIAGVSVADKSGPSLTINVGQPVRSDVLAEIWGDVPQPKVIEAHGEPVDERKPVQARELPERVDPPPEVLDDAER